MSELKTQEGIVLPNAKLAWVGIDLDGTLAKHPRGYDFSIGEPIPSMIKILIQCINTPWIETKIFTARWANRSTRPEQEKIIRSWLKEHVSVRASGLEITNEKDLYTRAIIDDRAIGVIMDTGELILPSGVTLDSFLNSLLTR